MATGDEHGVVRLWFVDGASQIGEFRTGSAGIERLAFSEDGNQLFSMDRDEKVIEWEIRRESRTPDQLAALIQHALPYRIIDGRVVLK